MSKRRKRPYKFCHSTEFIKEQAKWYKTLRKSGFDDIEFFSEKKGNDFTFMTISRNPGIGRTGEESNRQLAELGTLDRLKTLHNYYQSCRNFVCHGTFPSRLHKYVFQMHVNGSSYRCISAHLLKKFAKATQHRIKWWLGKKPDKRLQFSRQFILRLVKECITCMHTFNKTDPEGVEIFDDYKSDIEIGLENKPYVVD